MRNDRKTIDLIQKFPIGAIGFYGGNYFLVLSHFDGTARADGYPTMRVFWLTNDGMPNTLTIPCVILECADILTYLSAT